jgi:teichuronic acid exporter
LPNSPDLRKKTIESFQWNGVGYFLYYGFTLAGTAVLSRLVAPEQFGALGMLTVIVSITAFLVSLGLDFAVIQNRNLDDGDFSTFFWTNLILGLLFSIAFYLAAGQISDFYKQPLLIEPARIYSIIFFIQAIGIVPQAVLGKQLEFKKRVFAQLIAIVFSYCIAIPLAINGSGIWSLVAQVLIYNFLHVSLNFAFSKWRPRFNISLASFQKVKSFGAYFFVFQLLDAVAVNVDSLLIGKFLGAEGVAYFGRAIALVMMPVLGLSMIFIKTFYSFFSAMQQNREDLKREFMRAGGLIIFFAAPVLLWMAVFSTEIVIILFGKQWAPVAQLLTILAVPSIVSCYFGLADSFMTSIGEVKNLSKASIIEKCFYFVFIIVGLRFGLIGLAYAKFVAIIISSAVKFHFLRKSIQLTLFELTYSLRKNFFALFAFLLTCFVAQFVFQNTAPIVRLSVAVVTSFIVYVGALFVLKSEILLRVVCFIREKLRPNPL